MAELIPGASRLLKAASQLDSALRYAEGAVNVDVPFLLGRGAATELLQSHLGNSVEWAQSASVELASAPAGIEHVRSAVDELARAAAAIRDDHPVRGRGSSAFTDAIAGARQARADMYQHLDGLNAAANDDAAAWLDGSLAPGGDPSRIRATRDLVGMGAFGDLGDVGSFVERMAPDSPRSVELAALARASGAEAAGRALFEDAHAIAAAGAPVDAADFDLAFRAMGRPLPPAFVGRSDTARLDAFELAALRRAADTTDASALAARLAEQLDGPLRSPTPALLADLGALAELPSSLIDGLDPGVIAQSRSLAERLRAGTNRATQLPTGLTPSTQLLGMWKASAMSRGGGTTPVIQALLDQSDGGVEAAQRLATFVADDISGGPVAWREEILRKLNMADQDPAAGALIDALRIAGDGTSVAPALHQRALELARSGDTGPGTRRELATLAALPDELRPSFLDGERDRMLHEIAHDRTDVMGDVRWKADRTLIDADPEWGRSFAEEETRRLVALRTDASSADLLRLARLAQLPDELRPPLSRAITTAFTERTGAGHGIGDPEVARFLRAMRGELLSVDIERGNADVDTVRTQIRTLLAKPDAEITAADLDELAMLRAIPGPASPGMPAPVEYRLDQLVEYGYTGSAEAARRELDHLRTWLQRLDITSDSAVTRDTLRQDVRAIVAKPNAEVTPEHIRQLSVLGGVTGEKSLGIPRLRGNSLQDLASWRYGGTNAHAELDHLREWIQHLDIDADPSITRDTLREEVRAIVGKADGDVTADDVKRLAMLNDITGPKALEMPTVRSYSLRDAAGYGYAGSNLANQLDDLRAWVQRLDIDADPAITRDTLRTEVRTIVGKADVDVTHDDIKRLSLLNDITGAKSLEMPTTRDYSLRDLVSYNYGGSNATRQLDDLRAWIQRLDIDADPAITRDTLREEVRAIVGKADGDVSTADIKRLAMFNDITGAKALEMPKLRDTSLRDLVSYGYGGSSASHQLDDLRAWIQRLDIDADASITRDTLREEVRAIVDKADVDVSRDNIKRLSLLNDITGAKSLEMPPTRDYSLRDLVTYGYGGSNASHQLDDLRAWIQRLDIDADPAISRDTLREEVRAIVGKADSDVSTADIKRLAMFNDITGAKALEMPKLRDTSLRDLVSYGYGGSSASHQLDDLRAWIQRLDIDADPAITRDTLRTEVRAIIGKADVDVTLDDIKRLSLLNDITGAKSLEMPATRDYSLRDLVTYGYGGSNATRQLDELRAWTRRLDIDADASITRDTLRADVRSLLAKDNADITTDDIKRLSLLNDITGAKSLEMPKVRDYTLRDLVSYGYGGSNASAQLDDLRSWIQRLDIDADPAITADTLRSEVRTIIDKADADVTASDMRRLAFLNDVTGAKALGMPRLHDYQLRDLAGWNYAGTSASQALDELRTWSARAEIEHDPAITAKSLLDEVTAIAVKPLDELTSDDMMRLHVLSGMESAKAPGLPTLDYRSMSRTGVSSETQIDQLRTWAYTNSPEGLSALAMRLRAGETVGVETLRLVTGRSDELARLGIDRTSILSAAVRALRDKAETGAADQLAEIELVRAELASLTLTEPRAVQLRDTTLELVRDNVARMQGQKHDGYSRYPEFGEIGRIASNGELLGEIVRRSAPATSVAAPIPSAAGAGAATDAVATDAATGADLLTW